MKLGTTRMSDASYEIEGPSWEEVREDYLAEFKNGTYNQDMEKTGIEILHIGFHSNIEKIKKMIDSHKQEENSGYSGF